MTHALLYYSLRTAEFVGECSSNLSIDETAVRNIRRHVDQKTTHSIPSIIMSSFQRESVTSLRHQLRSLKQDTGRAQNPPSTISRTLLQTVGMRSHHESAEARRSEKKWYPRWVFDDGDLPSFAHHLSDLNGLQSSRAGVGWKSRTKLRGNGAPRGADDGFSYELPYLLYVVVRTITNRQKRQCETQEANSLRFLSLSLS